MGSCEIHIQARPQIVIISISFQRDHDLEAFEIRFDGQGPSADFSLRNGLDPPSRAAREEERQYTRYNGFRLAGGVSWQQRSQRRLTIFGLQSAKEAMELAARD